MSGISRKLMSAAGAAGGAGGLAIEDVFSTYLYTGNGSTQTITNDIDLAGEGGLVWIKGRPTSLTGHVLTDTVRGATKQLQSHTGSAEETVANGLTAFASDGFSIGSDANYSRNGDAFVSWTFRKAPRFFDVVTYTGTGSGGFTVPHNLGQDVGFIAVKRTDSAGDWVCWHRSRPNAYIVLQTTDAEVTTTSSVASRFGDNTNIIQPTSTEFTLGGTWDVNQSGGTYVAYLFAHDPLGPSEDGSDGLIACGSFTPPGGGGDFSGYEVNLGWEPQWVLMKSSSNAEDWYIFDMMRGTPVDYSGATGRSPGLRPNLSNAESQISPSAVVPTPTGFKINNSFWTFSSKTHIYIAIRRGPMRVPESGTEVFDADVQSNLNNFTTTLFPTDFVLQKDMDQANTWVVIDRLRSGRNVLDTTTTAAENTGATGSFETKLDFMNGVDLNFFSSDPSNNVVYNFRRAPGFFDVVAYTGDGVAGRTVPHNLGVAPELMIVKNRGDIRDWIVYHSALGATYLAELNTTAAAYQNSSYWPSVPTDSVFSPGNASATNRSGYNHIAYLFATLPGVSKVGSYTGNGTSQTINCGFTTGARFILIKRTDSTGDWYVWDTARGIVAGNDPRLSLNTTAAEVTTDDSIDPDSTGFIVNQVAATNINVNAASYIYLAIA